MAPTGKREKAGNRKTSAVVDGLSTEDMSKDQLEEHIVRLREELDREREERSYFQLEKDKVQALWEICRRHLEQVKEELRHRERERDEAKERHRVEISVYKQKLKHVLSEHHNTVSELKMDTAVAAALIQTRHTRSEVGLQRDLRSVQADAQEKSIQNENSIKELKLKHQVALMELTNDYGNRLREIQVKYHKKMEAMVEAEGKKRRSEVNEVEDRMKGRVVDLMEKHKRALRAAEEYYSSVQTKVLADQKVLKEEAAEAQKRLTGAEKELSAAQQDNRRLRESLQEAEKKLPELQQKLQDYHQTRAYMVAIKARVKVTEQELKDLTVEHELLLQAFEKVQQERDELLKKQTEAVFDLQQRSRLKEQLLEMKLKALTQTVEKKEAQLYAALSAAAVDTNLTADQMEGSTVANKLEEIFASKQVALRVLEEDTVRDCQEYNNLLHSCTEKLSALGVPLHDFPFRPQQQIQIQSQSPNTD